VTLQVIWLYIFGLLILVLAAIKAKAIQAGIEWYWKKLWNWSQLTVEIRDVCEDKILASLQVDRFTVDLYIFLRVWVVNKKRSAHCSERMETDRCERHAKTESRARARFFEVAPAFKDWKAAATLHFH
jgi:hypothetical protein